MDVTEQLTEAAQAILAGLLLDVKDGKEVAALDIAAARERVQMEELAALGRAARALTARAEAQRQAIEKLEGPLRDSLAKSEKTVAKARQHAAESLDVFLKANAAFIAECQTTAGQLIEAGRDWKVVQTTTITGVPQTSVGGVDFEYFVCSEEVVSLLIVMASRHQLRSADGITRDITRMLPTPYPGGPQKHIHLK